MTAIGSLGQPSNAQGESDSARCPRCSIPGLGKHCVECGHPIKTELLSVREFLREFKSEVLGLERRLFATFVSVVGRPGKVGLAYRDGTGSQYVSPLRFYLLAAGAYFAAHALTGRAMLQLGPLSVRVGEESVRPDVLLFFIMPLYAVCVRWVLAAKGSYYAEALAFVLNFQSAIFLLSIPVILLIPVPDWRGGTLLTYAVLYLALGGRRLWGIRPWAVGGVLRLIGAVLLYGVTIVLCAGGALLVGGV